MLKVDICLTHRTRAAFVLAQAGSNASFRLEADFKDWKDDYEKTGLGWGCKLHGPFQVRMLTRAMTWTLLARV